MISIKTSSRNGPVTGVRLAGEDDHLILISNKGKLIRMRAADISLQGRNTQGVRVMRLDEDEVVASIERLAEPEEEDTAETTAALATEEPAAPMQEVVGDDTVPVDMSKMVSDELAETKSDDDDEEPDA